MKNSGGGGIGVNYFKIFCFQYFKFSTRLMLFATLKKKNIVKISGGGGGGGVKTILFKYFFQYFMFSSRVMLFPTFKNTSFRCKQFLFDIGGMFDFFMNFLNI